MNKFRWFVGALSFLVLGSVVVYWGAAENTGGEFEPMQLFQSISPSIQSSESASGNRASIASENVTTLINALAANEKAPSSAASDDERDRLLRKLAELSPSAAIQQAQRATGERGLRFSLSILDVWSRKDFAAAWRWSESAGANLFAFRKALLASASHRNPELAIKLAREWSELQPVQAANIAAIAVDAFVGTGSYLSAMQFVQTSPLGVGERESLLRDIATTWTTASPNEAAEWALAQKEESYDVVMPAVVDSWLNADPFYAAEFVNSLPESANRGALMQEVVSRWLAIDQSGATHWLMAAGQRPEFDRAIFSYATADDVVRNNPDTALFWARRIADSTLKVSALQQILSDLKLANHPRADTYLKDAHELLDADRENLMQITAATP